MRRDGEGLPQTVCGMKEVIRFPHTTYKHVGLSVSVVSASSLPPPSGSGSLSDTFYQTQSDFSLRVLGFIN